MKEIIKKWWFWLIILFITIIVVVSIVQIQKNKNLEKEIETIGESSLNYYNGINKANSHLNEFTYNYETGQVEYKPEKITLEMYNRIKSEMLEDEVTQILGMGEKTEIEGANSYIITWGDLNLSNPPYYRIQIIFDKKTQTVISFNQIGLK